jgi:neutral ceramidase
MSIYRRATAYFVHLTILCSCYFSARASETMAGWAEVDITPPLGIGLGGRGGPQTKASKILDHLSAQVFFLQDAHSNGLVIASFDIVGMPHELGDKLKTDIVHELGVPWNQIILNASHTHSGPYMIRSLMGGVGPAPQIETDYFASLESKVVAATRAARKKLSPATVEVFTGKSHLGINRRARNKQGKMGMLPNPNAPYDENVWVLKATPANGAPNAVIFSYACHPVIVYGYAYAGISADFPGATRKELRGALGEKTHAQFIQGFAGDIRPRVVADLTKGTFRTPNPADLDAAGKQLSGSILQALKSSGRKLDLNIFGTADRPFLPRAEPPPRAYYEKMRDDGESKSNAWFLAVSDYWLHRYDAGEGFAKGDAWALGLLRLGSDQWIAYSGGEPCAEWRPKLKDWLGGLNIVTFGYVEAKSYLPTESMLSEGGYEVLESNQARSSTPAPFATGIEANIRDSFVRQLAFIRAHP